VKEREGAEIAREGGERGRKERKERKELTCDKGTPKGRFFPRGEQILRFFVQLSL
jgi:hypothetical protein